MYLTFICIAISSFENSKIAEHECVHLCDSLILAVLSVVVKGIKEGKWFSMNSKIFSALLVTLGGKDVLT
jgi:putative effector of murein hydrolase